MKDHRQAEAAKHWHQLAASEILILLNTAIANGLSVEEVKSRQAIHGPNRLSSKGQTPAWLRFLHQFNQPLVYLLLIASGVTAYLQEWVDSGVIFGVVMVNAIVGYLQEAKAEKAIDALSRMVVTETTVRRGGRKMRVHSEELVPGDVVLLQSGDKVPADLRLFTVRNLQVDESALTGESVPVGKHSDVLALDTILAERKNLAYAGTLVTYGQAEGVVWAIGNQTETGRIASLIASVTELSTPLTRKIAEFSKLLLWIIMGLAVVTFAVGILRGQPPVQMFMAAVALAVGAIPEGLPAAVTITLAIGVSRMAKRQAIIRKLPAVETLGSTTVICSDKTGTLTENQMTVQEIWAGGRFFEVTGAGYEAVGEVKQEGALFSVSTDRALHEVLKAGLLCNDTQLQHEDGRLTVQGDPTEAALLVAARKGGLVEAELHNRHARIDSIPFESEHQFMATLHHGGNPDRVIYKKGAVERLLDHSDHMLSASGEQIPLDRAAVRAHADAMAAKGLRVLAFARREVPLEHSKLEHHHVKQGLTFLGLQGMIDPPRAEAIQAVARCQQAGIAVKMITGDHALTAAAIADRIGLQGERDTQGALRAITGRELEKLSDDEFLAVAAKYGVFARVAPEQKLRLVKALQTQNHVVAMTGDGVNDAPALKQADIGIAMGKSGTDVAKGAADMLLTDDNFASIEAAVEEGRGVFDNLTKFIVWTIPTNLGEGLILLAAIFLGLELPALPVQLLWVNMMTATFLGLMLVFEPKEPDLMDRQPRNPSEPILTHPLFMRTGLVTLILVAGAFGLFLWEQQMAGATIQEARTLVINTIVMVEIFYLLNCRSLSRSVTSLGWFSNRWLLAGVGAMLLAQLFFTHLPVMNRWFHTAPIGINGWLHVLAVGLASFLIVGFEKWVRFHRIRKL